jgi:CheY-like chemotaxis protein
MDGEQPQAGPDATLIRRALAAFPNGSVNVFDRDYRYLLAQGRGVVPEGSDIDTVVGRRLADTFPSNVVALLDPHFRRAFAGEQVVFDLPLGPRTYEIHAAPLDYDGNTVATILAVATDVTATRTAEAGLRLLVEAGDALVSSLDIEATLGALAQLVVPRLADWCVIHLLGDDGDVERIALTHADPTKEGLARELVEGYPFKQDAPSGTARVMRTGVSELIPRVPDEMLAAAAVDDQQLALLRSVGLSSSIIVPMVARGRVLGAITLAVATPRSPYDEEALALAEDLARRATMAVDNARQYRLARQEWGERARAEAGEWPRHVLVVNRHANFLAFARVLLQGRGYAVTTSNLGARTLPMVVALAPDAIVVDLDDRNSAVWALLDGLAREPKTAAIPLVLTALDQALLARAEGLPAPAGGRFLLTQPLPPVDLIDTIHTLIGPA